MARDASFNRIIGSHGPPTLSSSVEVHDAAACSRATPVPTTGTIPSKAVRALFLSPCPARAYPVRVIYIRLPPRIYTPDFPGNYTPRTSTSARNAASLINNACARARVSINSRSESRAIFKRRLLRVRRPSDSSVGRSVVDRS